MGKIILHVDLNAFFVRCEEIKNPNLIGKAVIIGHEGRSGIVSTCSYKAREYGIHSGMPTFMATQKCKDLIIIPGDYSFYEEMSNKFFDYLSRFSDLIEKASIDECYVDMTHYFKKGDDVVKKLKAIQDGLYKETGLKCSIGISVSKFLAKMGSDYKKPMGLTIIHKRDISKILFPLKVESMFGVGEDCIECAYNLPLYELRQSAGTKGFVGRGKKKLDKWFEGIQEKDFTPSPSPLCHWCAFCPNNPTQPEEGKRLCPYYSLWTPNNKNFKVAHEWEGMDKHDIIIEQVYGDNNKDYSDFDF